MVGALIAGAVTAAVTFPVAYATFKYLDGHERGCNGHHWGDPYLPDDDGVSGAERKRAGLNPHEPRAHYTAKVLTDTVVVNGKAIQKCEDCGERRTVNKTIGSKRLSEFHDE